MITDIGSHFAQGDAPLVGFVQIEPARRLPAPAPLFLFGPASAVVNDEIYGQTALGEVGTYAIEDATVAPTGIAIKDRVAFSSTAFIHPPHHVRTVTERLWAADLPVRRVREPLAVIYGPGHQTYGHWLVDFLPRLWVLARCGYDLGAIRYLVPADLGAVARRLLAHLGIREAQLESYRYWREVLRADTLLMPTGLRTHNRVSSHFRAATAFWTARLWNRTLAPATARLFLSRAKLPAERVLDNRETIEGIAKRRGFTLVHPETLPLLEQATLFAGARLIVGEYGSALHGSVYAAPGTITVGLRGTARHPSFVQSGIAASLGQQVGYVLGETRLGATDEVGQVFTIRPADFERALDIATLVLDS